MYAASEMSLPLKVLTFFIAVIPAVVLLIFIYKKDRADKEPFGLLLLMFVLGMVCCLPAGRIESFTIGIWQYIMSGTFVRDSDGQLYYGSFGTMVLYQLVEKFLLVGLVEEGLKWIVMRIFVRHSKNFNSLFDGIIYAVCVSLGFAVVENIGYSFSYGIDVALHRALTAVPGHCFFAVFMGSMFSLYGLYHRNEEKAGKYLALSLIIPVLVHGAYDFFAELSGYTLALVLFYATIIGMYIVAFALVNFYSEKDKLFVSPAADEEGGGFAPDVPDAGSSGSDGTPSYQPYSGSAGSGTPAYHPYSGSGSDSGTDHSAQDKDLDDLINSYLNNKNPGGHQS